MKLLQHRNIWSMLIDFDPHMQQLKNAPKKALAGDCVGLSLGELAGRPKTAHSMQCQKMSMPPLLNCNFHPFRTILKLDILQLQAHILKTWKKREHNVYSNRINAEPRDFEIPARPDSFENRNDGFPKFRNL